MSQEVPDHFRWLYGGDMHEPQDYAARWHEDAVVNLAELESAASELSFEPVRVIDLPEPGRRQMDAFASWDQGLEAVGLSE